MCVGDGERVLVTPEHGGAEVDGTPGGIALRAVRQRVGRTQLWVEAEAELGSGYLQRVESGRVRQPERATVERVLEVLAARYSERRGVLERYGYRVVATAPTAADHAWASEVSTQELAQAPGPAYVLDALTWMVAVSPQFCAMLDLAPGDPRLADVFRRPLMAQWFDPASLLGAMVLEPDAFFPALLRALRAEMDQLRAPAMFESLLATQMQQSARFRAVWAAVCAEPHAISAARSLGVVRLRTRHAGDVTFRLASETFTRDARFRLIYLLAADAPTLARCAEWSSRARSG